MLKKSLENNSSQENTAVNELVENYKHSLLINNYKEQLIKQQLDTVISEAEIDTYYTLNKQNFKLNEELLKIKFLNFNNNLINKKEVVALFKSDDLEDSEALENYHLNFKSFQLNDSVWIPLDNIMLKIPFSKEKLLKKTKFIQKQDSLSLYLVAVKDVLKRNELAPKSYIKSTIKQLILHQRKIELIREIEQIIVKDAIQNDNFKIY
jgi:adenylate cyclase class IV